MHKILKGRSSGEENVSPSDGGRAKAKVPSRKLLIIVTIDVSFHVVRRVFS